MRVLTTLAVLSAAAATDVYVMLPLDAVTPQNTVNNPNQLISWLTSLKNIGVAGFMTDVWFGVCEPQPQQYNFTGYRQLADIAANLDMKVQLVTSFHKCGTNGGACNTPLPSWVLQNSNGFYKDREGNVNDEYISLFAVNESFAGRTPVRIYADFMKALNSAMDGRMGSTVVEVMVGLGPSGEMRYPAYQTPEWSFCGVGEFQCYDANALSSLAAAASDAGHPEWGNGGPNNAGSYRSQPPSSTGFFGSNGDNYQSDYGRFFLNWYFESLLAHGDRILSEARAIWPTSSGVAVTAKVAGIHWWYKDGSHAAEVTAGYYNTNERDAYGEMASMFAKHDATMDFTAFEMQDSEQPASCGCAPYELVDQAKAAAQKAGIPMSGENALNRYDTTAYNTVVSQSHGVASFTYLRLGSTLMQQNNLNTFATFVSQMKSV